MILPLGDTSTYWNNIQLMYTWATARGVQLKIVLFPKWKYGAEYCYLYNTSAPSGCQLVSGTTTAVAYQKLLNIMAFVQALSGSCTSGSYNRQFAVWYGWKNSRLCARPKLLVREIRSPSTNVTCSPCGCRDPRIQQTAPLYEIRYPKPYITPQIGIALGFVLSSVLLLNTYNC